MQRLKVYVYAVHTHNETLSLCAETYETYQKIKVTLNFRKISKGFPLKPFVSSI